MQLIDNNIPMIRQSLDVDSEYTEAFHSNSFLHIWAEAHQQTRPTPSPKGPNSNIRPLPNFLLEPTQSSLLAAAAAAGGSSALLDYIDATFQSFSACAVLLAAINRTRAIHRSVRHNIHRLAGGSSADDLSSNIDIENPLSSKNLAPFHHAHSLYQPLLTRLTTERRRLRRRARAVRAAKNAAGIVVIAAVGAVTVVAVVILTHGLAVVVAASAVPTAGAVWQGGWRRWGSAKWMEKAEKKVDAAARGAYIVGRDMDMVSRMVRRAHDEVEHRRDMVRFLSRINGEGEIMKEVVREMESDEVGFEEHIEELEDHVYLCLLTINRSRRLVHG